MGNKATDYIHGHQPLGVIAYAMPIPSSSGDGKVGLVSDSKYLVTALRGSHHHGVHTVYSEERLSMSSDICRKVDLDT